MTVWHVSFIWNSLQANQQVVQAKPSTTPAELVSMVYSAPDVRKSYKNFKPRDFCLKVLGMEEYLLDDVPLYRFKVNMIWITCKPT